MPVTIHTKQLDATDSGLGVGAAVRVRGDERMTLWTIATIEARTFVHTNFRGLCSTDGDCVVHLVDDEGITTQTQAHSVLPADAPWSESDQMIVDARQRTAARWLRPMIKPDDCIVLRDTPDEYVVGVWCDVCKTWHERQFTPAEVAEFREPIFTNLHQRDVTVVLVDLRAVVSTYLANTPVCNRPADERDRIPRG